MSESKLPLRLSRPVLCGLALTAVALGGVADPGVVPLEAPEAASLPGGPLGDSIARGRDLLQHTAQRLPGHVGNALTCQNCHLGNGREVGVVANAAPLIGVVGRYPQYSERRGAIEGLEQRINDCFERSMNGTALPLGDPAMLDMVAYMTWLSRGVPVGARVRGQGIPALSMPDAADPQRGAALFSSTCAACHGQDGAGTKAAGGGYAFPPLWGDLSFNAGAGMAHHATAAGFIKHKMPLGSGDSLSDQDAWDLSAYVLSHARPNGPDEGG